MRIELDQFERFVREHHAGVFRAVHRVLRNTDDAQDVTQALFLRLLEGRIDLEDARDPGAVLCFFGVKDALSQLRKDRSRTRNEEEYAMENNSEQTADKAQQAEVQQRVSVELQAMED